jgi:hypothetical protein
MAKYMCQCGMYLKPKKLPSDRKSKSTNISYKVLIVRTETHYVCPNGCELKNVKVYK